MSSNTTVTVGRSLLLAVLTTIVASGEMRAQEERGFLGINLDCGEKRGVEVCRMMKEGDSVVWWFAEPPLVNWVRERGPAYLGGLRPGDVILSINGIDIVTDRGGRLFGSMQVGEDVAFLVRRNGLETVVTVTPTSEREAFGNWAFLVKPEEFDSLRVQFKLLFESQENLKLALQEAERVLRVTEAQVQRVESEDQRQVLRLRQAEVDSLKEALGRTQVELRLHADTLAARTLYVVPGVEPDVEVRVVTPPGEKRTIVLYPDAVAGARFKELREDSDMAAYFGVKQGLLITHVVEDTPAHAAGLREGDVVLAVNERPVSTVSGLRKVMAAGEAELTYVRKGKKEKCTISK